MSKSGYQKKPIAIAVIALLAAVAVLCIFAYQLIFRGCFWWECAPNRSFSVLDLNLPTDLFPVNAEIHSLQLLRGDNSSLQSAATTNYWDNGVAIYIVRRYATYSQAGRDYSSNLNYKFATSAVDLRPYSDLLGYRSTVADESGVRCGYVLNDLRCVYIARYREFTILFSGSIGTDEMSDIEFLQVMQYIDGKMSALLSRKQ